jgi:NAD(P)-dependent dehydrogenase (short-subunit alcohol dehydrogenase family)
MRRTVLIIGGGTGIGFATAERLVGRGLAVALTGRRADVLQAARTKLLERADGTEVHAFAGDAGDADDAERVVEAAADELNGLDLCVNCAGVYEPVNFLRLERGSWERTIHSTLNAVAFPSVAAARRMAARGRGRFVLVSSISDPLSEPDATAYSVAKAGVSSLARSMALDLAGDGIQVNAVAPGWIHTDMVDEFVQNATPESLSRLNMLGRVGQPDEVANVVEYLGLDAPDFLTGATVFVDGGQTSMAPLL